MCKISLLCPVHCFFVVIHCLWLLPSLYPLFSNDLRALGTNVFYTVIMKSVILHTLTSSGSLPIVIYQKEEAEAGGGGGEKEGGEERKGEG